MCPIALGRLTSGTGVLLLREVDQKIGLLDALNEAIPDPRDPRMTGHRQRTMLTKRIFSMALGYGNLNDQQMMRTDAALQIASGVSPVEDEPMASPSMLCRLENFLLRQTLVRLSKFLSINLLLPAILRPKKSHWTSTRSIPWLPSALLLPAAVCVLWQPVVVGLSSARQHLFQI